MASKKSLGTLTLDLIAQTGGFAAGMSKAERSSKKWRSQVERDMKKAGKEAKVRMKGIAVAAAGAAAGLTAMAVVGLRNVDAQAKLARSLNTTFDSVTSLNLAFDEGGIDGYEMSLARLNRRLGAAENGSGEAAKTVEALNLNLDELSGLEADERLARIADAMVESGASAQQAARYAQQLGFEQKEAAQFFLQGGDAIRGYRKEVDEFGLALTAIETKRIEDANDAFGKLGRATTFLQQQLASGLAPVVTTVSNHVTESFKDASGSMKEDISGAIQAGVGGMADMVDASAMMLDVISDNPMSSQFGVLGWLLLGPKGALIGAAIGATFDVIEEGMARVGIGISDSEDAARSLANVQEQIQRQEEIILKAREMNQGKSNRFVEEAASQIAELRTREAELKQQVSESTEAQDTYNQIMNEGTDKATGFSGSLRRLAGSLRGIEWDNMTPPDDDSGDDDDNTFGIEGPDEAAKKIANRRKALLASLETEKQAILAAFGERDAEITELRENQALTEMEANNLRLQNERAMYESLDAMRQENIEKEEDAVRARLSAAADVVSITSTQMNQMEGLYGEMGALGKAFFVVSQGLAAANAVINGFQAAMAIRVAYAQLAAMTANPALLGAGEVHANITQGMGFAAAAGIMAETVASFEGGGYTGSGPRSGGLDGKGGFMAMLHPDETVTDNTLQKGSGAGGTSVTVNLYEDNSKAGTVEQRQRPDGGTDVNVFVADIMSNGPRSKALESAYGLRRQGR